MNSYILTAVKEAKKDNLASRPLFALRDPTTTFPEWLKQFIANDGYVLKFDETFVEGPCWHLVRL